MYVRKEIMIIVRGHVGTLGMRRYIPFYPLEDPLRRPKRAGGGKVLEKGEKHKRKNESTPCK